VTLKQKIKEIKKAVKEGVPKRRIDLKGNGAKLIGLEFLFSEDQEMLASTIRDFLAGECTADHVRGLWETETGRSPEFWQKLSLFNPIVHLIRGFRWTFYENADVSVTISVAMTGLFMFGCMTVIWWIFRTGYRLRT